MYWSLPESVVKPFVAIFWGLKLIFPWLTCNDNKQENRQQHPTKTWSSIILFQSIKFSSRVLFMQSLLRFSRLILCNVDTCICSCWKFHLFYLVLAASLMLPSVVKCVLFVANLMLLCVSTCFVDLQPLLYIMLSSLSVYCLVQLMAWCQS